MAQNNHNEGENTVFYVLPGKLGTNSSETVENLLMQNAECMKSSQTNVATSQRQSLQETGEPEETTSDPRNAGRDFLIKINGSALLLSLSSLKLRAHDS